MVSVTNVQFLKAYVSNAHQVIIVTDFPEMALK